MRSMMIALFATLISNTAFAQAPGLDAWNTPAGKIVRKAVRAIQVSDVARLRPLLAKELTDRESADSLIARVRGEYLPSLYHSGNYQPYPFEIRELSRDVSVADPCRGHWDACAYESVTEYLVSVGLAGGLLGAWHALPTEYVVRCEESFVRTFSPLERATRDQLESSCRITGTR